MMTNTWYNMGIQSPRATVNRRGLTHNGVSTMSTDNSKRTNRKLQIIDLTSDTFEFSDQGFKISGFISNDHRQWFSAKVTCDNLGLSGLSRATSRLPWRDKAIITSLNNGIPVRHLYVSKEGLDNLRHTRRFRLEKAFVYIIQVGDYPEYKIGYVANLESRLTQFRTGLPSLLDVRVIASICTYDYIQLEIALHRRFSTKRTRGEWFALTQSDLRQVNRWLAEEQRAGYFIENSLPRRDRD